MNERQKRFADEYIISGNGTQAYMIAYPNIKKETTARAAASRLLANVNVKSYISERLEELKKDSIAEQDEVLQYLTSVMRGEMKDEALMVVPVGDFESEVQRHDQRADTSQRTKAAELLGRRYAMWTDKQITDTTERITFIDDLDDLDD